MKEIECPLCGELLQIPEKVFVGQTFDCFSCDSTIEVISIDPLRLDSSYGEGDELVYKFRTPEWQDEKNRVMCPRCGKNIHITEKVWIGDHLICKSCGMEYQIIGLNPIEIDLPYDASDANLKDDDDKWQSYYDLYKKIDF